MGHFFKTWSQWTTDGEEAIKNVVPLSFVYSPLRQVCPEYDIPPIQCSKCEAVLSETSYASQGFKCVFCSAVTRSRVRFAQDTEIPEIIYSQAKNSPSFRNHVVLLLDLTAPDLEQLKQVLLQSLCTSESPLAISLILFSRHIYVFEFSSDSLRCFSLNGQKAYSSDQILSNLQISLQTPESSKRFFTSADSFSLISAIETLEYKESAVKGLRRERAAGLALQVSIELMKEAAAGKPGQIIFLLSGAATVGVGKIVNLGLEETIRTFADIKASRAPHLAKAKSFYEGLAVQLRKTGHTVDIFSCSIDQCGLFELESITEATGGYMFLFDCCGSNEFKSNFLKYFKEYLTRPSRCSVVLRCSKNVEVCGCIAQGYSFENNSSLASKIKVGLSGTNAWAVNAVDPNSSFTFFFHPKDKTSTQDVVIQVETRFITGEGTVKTVVKLVKFAKGEASQTIFAFNNETSAVITAKLAVWRLKQEDFLNVSTWVDKSLIAFAKRFALIEDKTVNIPSQISLFPQFLYFLRRSQFINAFNVSPDESAFYRQMMLRSSVAEAILMIEPVLLSYSFNSDLPEPQFLSPEAMKKDRLLLLDSFFTVVIWHGPDICAWIEAEYHLKPEYENFACLLDMPVNDSGLILQSRFPIPKLVMSKPRDGTERYIKAKLNTQTKGQAEQELFSDIMSIETFIEKLKSFVIK